MATRAATSLLRASTTRIRPPFCLRHYTSPLQDLFDRMENHPQLTALGTTEPHKPRSRVLSCGLDESLLRFSTTTYGRIVEAPHVHPKEHQVVMKVNTQDLRLSPLEESILQQIVGARWNMERKELRLTSNVFGSRIENKRHLVSMLDRIVSSAKRLAHEIVKDEEESAGKANEAEG